MKRYILISMALGFGYGVWANDMTSVRRARRYGAEAKIVVSVVHEDGSFVSGAEVRGTFPKVDTRNSKYFQRVNVQTDINGQATLQASCGGDVFISVKKAGYYPSREVVFFNTGKPSCVKDGRWQPWGYSCKVVLKPKKFLRNLITNWDQDTYLELPGKFGDKIGFDLERKDWVSPHGKGIVADFFVSGHIRTEELPEHIERRKELTLHFPREADGAYQVPISLQSYLQTPHRADFNATYEKELHFWRDESASVNAKLSVNALEKECLILRTRTICDVSGKIISAHYTVIDAPLILCGRPDNEIHLFYFYNPTPNDPWLESERRANLKGRTLRGVKQW